MIRDGIKSVNKEGVCSEIEWPYRIKDFAKKPPAKSYDNARFHKSIQYQRVTRALYTMRHCLASGHPFTFGFMVYESFESDAVAKTGIVPMPRHDESALGGHAVLAVGYDDTKQRFIVRNSWGKEWGEAGNFYMPYAYLLDSNLADDFWTIQRVGGLQQ
jgi:C1A family cysteine protease